jgi:hypothetical protein
MSEVLLHLKEHQKGEREQQKGQELDGKFGWFIQCFHKVGRQLVYQHRQTDKST